MASNQDSGDRMTRKRTIYESGSLADTSMWIAERVEGGKRSRGVEGFAPQSVDLPFTAVGSTLTSKITEDRGFNGKFVEIPAAAKEAMDTSLSSKTFVESSGADPTEVAESCSVSCLASDDACSTENLSSEVDGLGELVPSTCSSESVFWRDASVQAAESCCSVDTQLDISCFLEIWDADAELLASNCLDVFEGNKRDLPSGLAESLDGDADWFFGDVENDGERICNENADQEQEWISAAFANLDRLTETCEADASMIYFLEAGTGV